jgi:hypothetical protein
MLAGLSADRPLPPDLELTSTDTLGAVNAEFFARRAKDSTVVPEDVVRSFLRREFGEEAASLTPVFLRLQSVLGKIFYTDKNYYGLASLLPRRVDLDLFAVSVQLTLPPGTQFPTPEAFEASGRSGYPILFTGWPAPLNHQSAGAEAMLREKEDAVAEAEEMLELVRQQTRAIRRVDREFLVRQFEDLLLFARASRWLLEAHAHHYLTQAGERRGALPDVTRFEDAIGEIVRVAEEWQGRYPGGRYFIAETLRAWVSFFRGEPGSEDFLDVFTTLDLLNSNARER